MIEINVDSIRRVFDENFASRGEIGASVSIWQAGREVVTLAGGFCERERERPWTADTPTLIWSATKGPASACVLHALEAAGVGLDEPVASRWPEFAQAGKGSVTIAELLSHRAGLAALEAKVSVLDYGAVVAALAAQAPLWPRGEGHGYHTRTFGFLEDELLRRVQPPGMTLGRYWREKFADPLGLDVWIGLPDELQARVATTYPARVPGIMSDAPDPLYQALADPASMARRSFTSPAGLHSVSSMMSAEARRAEFPAFGGIGSARGLAKFYARLAVVDDVVFSPAVRAAMMTPLVSGSDRVLCTETCFAVGFMLDPRDAAGAKLRQTFGPVGAAFGHPGAGGLHAFADPGNQLAFAYVMNQMELGVFPNRKALALVEALYAG